MQNFQRRITFHRVNCHGSSSMMHWTMKVPKLWYILRWARNVLKDGGSWHKYFSLSETLPRAHVLQLITVGSSLQTCPFHLFIHECSLNFHFSFSCSLDLSCLLSLDPKALPIYSVAMHYYGFWSINSNKAIGHSSGREETSNCHGN